MECQRDEAGVPGPTGQAGRRPAPGASPDPQSGQAAL